jgi:flagellar biosynthesis/type III secretory pathway protein FliH
MCEALRELMKDDIAQGRAEGRAQGRAEGAKELLFSLVKDGLISIKEAAARLNLTEAAFIDQMNAYQQ